MRTRVGFLCFISSPVFVLLNVIISGVICQIGRGVRQGCSLSPLLFIIFDEAMVKEATAKEELGVKVGGDW